MTQPEIIPVTAADRAQAVRYHVLKGMDPAVAESLVADWADDCAVLQLLARHRIENVKGLVEAVEQAAAWFDEYATEHYAKAKTAPDYREQGAREDKGKRNKERAQFLRAALSNQGTSHE